MSDVVKEFRMNDISQALKPYGYEWLVSVTGICGPGSLIVVFASKGDFCTACLTHDDQVVWVMTCGGQEVDASTDAINDLHAQTRRFYHLPHHEPALGGDVLKPQGF